MISICPPRAPLLLALLLGEPEDLFLEDLAVGTGFVAYAGEGGEDQSGQGNTYTEDGESFLAESGHVGLRRDEQW